MGQAVITILAVLYLIVAAAIWGLGLLFGWKLLNLVVATILAVAPMGAIFLVLRLIAIRKEKAFERRIAAQGGGGEDDGSKEMQEQFQKGLKLIRESHFSRTALTSLPWYLIMGAPGAGKTTAISESGLTFPSLGQGLRSFRGIGGTRNVDWWITEEAFFLDTAGRYTTQGDDREEWFAFLDLVKRHRRQMAINGVIVAVSVLDLLKKDEAAREAHAQLLRDRIEEVASRLEVQLPVYLMFTKCDMISGFKKFFEPLSRGEKDQVLGATLSWPPEPGLDHAQRFREEMASLRPGLTTHRLKVVGMGLEEESAVKSVRFPGQLGRVQAFMEHFVGALFRSGRIREHAGLRGFYLTSGTQPGAEGESGASPTVPDPDKEQKKAAATTANPFAGSIFLPAPGSDATPIGSMGEDRTSGMFLRNLFLRVIIPDARLVRFSQRRERRQRMLTLSCKVGSPAVAALIALLIILDHAGSLSTAGDARELIERMREDRKAGREALPLLIERMDALRRLMDRIEQDEPPGLTGLRDDLATIYYRHLREIILDPAAKALAGELQQEREGVDLRRQYDLYIAYKTLGGEPQEEGGEAFARTMRQDQRWLAPLGESDDETTRLADMQLDYLVAHPEDSGRWEVTLDQTLLDRLQLRLADSLLIQQGYDQVLRSIAGLRAEISRDSLVSGAHRELLVNEQTVPGTFTHEAWNDLVRARLEGESQELEGRFAELGKAMDAATIMQRLTALYQSDHQQHWIEFIRATGLASSSNLREAGKKLGVLVGPQSPYRELLRAAWREAAFDLGDGALGEGLDERMGWYEDLAGVFEELDQTVQRFEGATDFGRRSYQPDEVGRLVRAVEDTRLKAVATLRDIPQTRLQAAMRASCEAVLLAVFESLGREIASEQNNMWRDQVAQPFAAELAGRYPFAPTAEQQLPLADFARFFNPVSGLIDARVEAVAQLHAMRALDRPLIETSRDYERLAKRFATIQELLFEQEREAPIMTFTATLQQRQGVKDMALTVGEDTFSLYDAPVPRSDFSWNKGGATGAKIAISIPGEQWLQIADDGPWGLFKVFDQAEVEASGGGGWLATWTFTSQAMGGDARFKASVLLSGGTVDIAFDQRDLLSGFVCPERVTP